MAETEVDRFLAALGTDFYADDAAIRRAIRQHSSVNLIHQPSVIKMDVFIVCGSSLDDQQIGRLRRVQVSENPDRYLYAHTPEDILLQKLRWFRLGQEVSDRPLGPCPADCKGPRLGNPGRSGRCQHGERAGRVKTAKRRREVSRRPSAPG
jgi:hypothetical protein